MNKIRLKNRHISRKAEFMRLSRIPKRVENCLASYRPKFNKPQADHYRIWCWIIVTIIMCQGAGRLKELVKYMPERLAYWTILRMMRAKYWDEKDLLEVMAGDTLTNLRPPLDRILHLIGDTTRNEKTGKKQPLAYTTKMGKFEPYLFGQSILVMIAHWGKLRIPVAVAVIDPKIKGHQNKLFRQMLKNFKPPAWCKQVIVEADAGFAAKETLRLILKLEWDYVFSLARTWKLADGTYLSNLARHLPRKFYHRVASYKLNGQRRDYWIFRRKAKLNLLGDVTIILSKRHYNDSPKNIKLIVTNLNEASGGEILSYYAKRWSVELTFKELKSGLHLGQMQVTSDPQRVERSILLPVMAYLLLLRLYGNDDTSKQGFSIFKLKERFIDDVVQEHIIHSDQRWLKKVDKYRAAA